MLGGAYTEGSNTGPFELYNGNHVAAHGVVVVSCNYRLGALGALVHDGGLKGNQGLLDQRQCLKWVQQEVKHFGGDPSQVTAWGQSAGAQSVWLHMATEGSAGLFHRAVLESAPDLSLLPAKDQAHLGNEVAKKLGCTNKTAADIVACMKAADVQAVCKAASDAEGDWLTVVEALDLPHITGSFLPFKPHVDGEDIKEQPFQTLLDGRAPGGVPTLLGFTHDEMWALMPSLPKWVKGLAIDTLVTLLFGLKTGPKAWKHYKGMYPGDDDSALAKLLTDYLFTCAGQAAALALPAPSYVYAYNHFDSFAPSLFAKFGLPECAIDGRVCHMAELPLFWNQSGPASLNCSLSPTEQQMSSTLIGAITSFAKGGDPQVPGWAPYTNSSRAGLIVTNTTAAPAPLGAAADVCVDIWDQTGYLH